MSYSKIGITINDWINYKPSVGVEILTISGLPGWGKTNMAFNLVHRCRKKGEILVMPGDRFCEWRHLTRYSKTFPNITVIIPKNIDIFYYNKKLIEMKKDFLEREYSSLDIMNEIETNDASLLIIYDAHLTISERTFLWVNILDQILNRRTHLNKAITMLFNEAGILFPETAAGDHWKAVDKFAEIIVDCRKGLARLIFVSQLQNEIKSTIRKKAMFRIFRKGFAGRGEPKPLQKATPFAARNEYHLSVGGLYVRNNIIDKFKEVTKIWKMIPPRTFSRTSINESGAVGGKRDEKNSLEFVQKVRSKGRISWNQQLSDLGAEEGDEISVKLTKLI